MTLAGAELDISLKGLLSSIAHEPTLIMHANAHNTSKLIEFCKLALTVGHLEPEDVSEIAACPTRAEKCRDRRNTIVHAIYAPAESGGGVETMNPVRKKLGYRASAVSVEEMEALADEVTVLRDDIFTAGWNATVGKLPGMEPSPRRAPARRSMAFLLTDKPVARGCRRRPLAAGSTGGRLRRSGLIRELLALKVRPCLRNRGTETAPGQTSRGCRRKGRA
ncbi:hypothetical protein OHA71_42715 [Streptomyces sp. NBC_00444]|uniref:hypothetical protein n=1 Tax=Streptomyces sp. NBC_00444 TaxID=2975744 RepID=UPI002E2498B3